MAQKSAVKTIVVTLLKYGLGLGVLAYVLASRWNPDPNKPGDVGLAGVFQRKIHFDYLLLAAVIASSALVLTFIRWWMLVRAVGLPFTLRNALRLGLIGYYFNTFLPGSVGGDILKAINIAREQSRRTVAVATVLIDRIIGLWALAWFAFIVGGVGWIFGESHIVHQPELQTIVRWSGYLAVACLLMWFAMGLLSNNRATRFATRLERFPKIGGSLAELWRACWLYRQKPLAVFIAMLMSLVGHTGWVAVYHFSVQAFETPDGQVLDFAEHLIIVPVAMVVQALFPSPSGIGGGEAAYGKLYEMLGKPFANGVVGSLAQRIIFWGLGFLGALIYTQMKHTAKSPEEIKTEKLEEEKPLT